ncbi:Uncharacterised protein [Bordetella pertussis]|nr:Uncharacterised protein [Bordetella pertussis]
MKPSTVSTRTASTPRPCETCTQSMWGSTRSSMRLAFSPGWITPTFFISPCSVA